MSNQKLQATTYQVIRCYSFTKPCCMAKILSKIQYRLSFSIITIAATITFYCCSYSCWCCYYFYYCCCCCCCHYYYYYYYYYYYQHYPHQHLHVVSKPQKRQHGKLSYNNYHLLYSVIYICLFILDAQLLIMAMASASTDHWQVGKSLTECNQFMLENNFYYDVTFTLDYKYTEET